MRLSLCTAALLLLLPAIAEAQAKGKAPPAKRKVSDQDAAAAAAAGTTIIGGFAVGTVLCIASSVLFVVFYLSLPILVAFQRGHPDAVAISAVTLLFGWTFVGWGIALIWALKDFKHYQHGAVNVSIGNVGAASPVASPPVARPVEVRYEDLQGRNPFDFG